MHRAALLAAALCAAATLASAEDAPFTLPPATSAPHVDFSADRFDYSESSSVIHLKGKVNVRESTWTIRADRVWMDLDARRAEADGYVQMDDGTSVLSGDFGVFYFGPSTGSVLGAAAGYPPWRIFSKEGRVDAKRRVHFSRAWFTSCNESRDPHYKFQSSSVHVRPKKYLTAWNTLFYLGPVPVFYTPFMWKSLRREHLIRSRVSPGYDHRNGPFVKSTTQYNPTRYIGGRFYLDYYGRQGLGLGNEFEYRRPGVANGGLFGYRIRERNATEDRWAVAGDHFQSVVSSVNFQMHVQAQSDKSFNNDYMRAHSLPISPELRNSAAFVHQTRKVTTRLSYSRLDEVDPMGGRYFKSRESAPRLDVQTAPLNLGVPFLNTFSAFADNSYQHGLGFLEKSVGAGWTATRAVPIARGVSFTPTVGLGETFVNRVDEYTGTVSSATYRDAFVTRYSAAGNLRVGTPAGDLDLGHDYVRRLRPDSLALDLSANDKGVERNVTTLQDFFRPGRTVFVRVQSGYDWRTYRDHRVGFRDRIQPIVSDLVWSPRPFVDLSLHDAYDLNYGDQAFAAQLDFGERKRRFVGFGVGTNEGSPNHYFVSQEFAWTPSSGTWSAGGVLRQDLRSARGGFHFDSLQLFDKEMWVVKDWHDFQTRFQFRIRPGGVKEVQVRLELRLDKERPLPGGESPWRLWKSKTER